MNAGPTECPVAHLGFMKNISEHHKLCQSVIENANIMQLAGGFAAQIRPATSADSPLNVAHTTFRRARLSGLLNEMIR